MKMTKSKKYMAGLLFAACLTASAVGLATVKEVAADPVPGTSPYSTLAMEDGASVRIADTKKDAGIRFHLTLSKSEYETLTDAEKSPYEDVSFGVLIAPEDYLIEGKELNEANVFGIGGTKIYGWAERNADGTWADYTGSEVEIVNFNTKTMTLEDGEYSFYGALVNILDGTNATTNNVSREFRGVGYMLYKEKGSSEQKVALVGDDDNVRSIAYVTQKAIEAGTIKNAADADRMEEFYVDGVKSEATVNYYKLNENGKYDLDSTVTSDEMQIGDTFTATKNSYAGYIFDAGSSNLSGTVYANGKTTLNVYYNLPSNVLANANSWALMLNGGGAATNTVLNYKTTIEELEFEQTNTDPVHYELNFTGGTKNYKMVNDETQSGVMYKNKQVAHAYPMYANSRQYPVIVGGNLSSLTEEALQALIEDGYTSLTFSFVHTTYSYGSRNSGYYLLDLDAVKADESIALREDDGTIDFRAFKKVANTSNTNATNWVNVEYSLSDILACYDRLFANETYWTLAIPYGSIGNNRNTEGEVCGYFYMTNLVLKQPFAAGLSNVLPTENDWAVRLGGWSFGGRMGLDYSAEETIETVAWDTSNNGFKVVKQSAATADHGVHYTRQVALTGRTENITYKNKEVGFSFPLLPNNDSLPIFIGANLSHVTKADLEILLAAGYTKLSFSFVHNATFEGLAQTWGYYLLDLETVKNNPDMKLRAETFTDSSGTYTNRVNVNAFKKVAVGTVGGVNKQNNDGGLTREWVDVEYAIEDLIACYDQLFAGEDYWTLVIPYGSIGHYNKGLTETGGEIGRTYVTKLAFTK